MNQALLGVLWGLSGFDVATASWSKGGAPGKLSSCCAGSEA